MPFALSKWLRASRGEIRAPWGHLKQTDPGAVRAGSKWAAMPQAAGSKRRCSAPEAGPSGGIRAAVGRTQPVHCPLPQSIAGVRERVLFIGFESINFLPLAR